MRSHLTLGLCMILHAFTHAYGSMLVPLYFRMVDDLKLNGVGAATLVVTVYGAVYNLGSYAGGIAADRFSRKKLLAIGLLGNAAAILGIGLTRNYPMILCFAAAAGIFGTIFHPAANALVPSHYPKSPGMAIGLLGAGSGLGFFLGPQIAGWRATTASWQLWHVAQWQKPCVELGIIGLAMGLVFLIAGTDPHISHRGDGKTTLDRDMKWRVAWVAIALCLRDFAGVAGTSLAAIYVRNVFHLTVAEAGLFVGIIMVPSIFMNPISVLLTPGKKRLPGLSIVLVAGGIVAVTAPAWPLAGALVSLGIFQTLQMGSYAVSDAAILERVDPMVRGRVVGLFLLIAGTVGAMGPWVMGAWVDALGGRAGTRAAYFGPFGLICICMAIAAFSPRFIAKLGRAGSSASISPLEEISPATMG